MHGYIKIHKLHGPEYIKQQYSENARLSQPHLIVILSSMYFDRLDLELGGFTL
jgi:hypothetical protein